MEQCIFVRVMERRRRKEREEERKKAGRERAEEKGSVCISLTSLCVFFLLHRHSVDLLKERSLFLSF